MNSIAEEKWPNRVTLLGTLLRLIIIIIIIIINLLFREHKADSVKHWQILVCSKLIRLIVIW